MVDRTLELPTLSARRLVPAAIALLGVFALGARPALAALPKSTTIERAQRLAARRGWTTREVEAGPSFNRVTRLALPLRNNDDWKAIVDTFGLRKNPDTGKYEGSLIFRQMGDDMTVVVPPKMGLGNMRALDPTGAVGYFALDQVGNGVIVHLGPEQADHAGRWLEARTRDHFFRSTHSGCSDMMMNIEIEPAPNGTHTVREVSDTEAASVDASRSGDGKSTVAGSGVPMGKTVAEHTGVRASKKGSYMLMKWNWSGSDRVQVMLVHEGTRARQVLRKPGERLSSGVQATRPTLELTDVAVTLATMTDDELLGPQHPHGVDAAARPPMSETARARLTALTRTIQDTEQDIAKLVAYRDEVDELARLDASIGTLKNNLAAAQLSRAPSIASFQNALRARSIERAKFEASVGPGCLAAAKAAAQARGLRIRELRQELAGYEAERAEARVASRARS